MSVRLCSAFLILYSALKSARDGFIAAMVAMARFSFFFFIRVVTNKSSVYSGIRYSYLEMCIWSEHKVRYTAVEWQRTRSSTYSGRLAANTKFDLQRYICGEHKGRGRMLANTKFGLQRFGYRIREKNFLTCSLALRPGSPYTVYGVIHSVHGIYSHDCDLVLLILRIRKTSGSLG
jgi:hypothetical protein